MRVVLQRVSEASVKINGRVTSSINHGLVLLLGVSTEDDLSDVLWLVNKISSLRIFPDIEGKMNKSVIDIGADVLLVSQFTLFASTKKGNRPSFIRSAHPDIAIPLYETFQKEMEQALGKSIFTGEFGADMKVSLINDGPVTINLDSKNKE
jgi:D-tyrosyl-tRNA(Tyr) deacylase